MKRLICSVITAVMMLSIFSDLSFKQVLAEVNGPEVFGNAYCVMNADSGEVVIEKNKDQRLYPASITKVMTALIAIEECKNLEDTITFSGTALQISSISSTLSPRAEVGEKMSFMDVLYGLLLSSGNECANALAEYTSGDIGTFVEKMNARAQQIGAVNTHFVNTHGLHDENHYTTAYDIALIFREALKNETFVKVASTGVYEIPKTNKAAPRRCENGHRMVLGTMPCEGTYAGKSGRTKEAGRTLLTAAKRDGVTMISSLLKSNDDNFYNDTQILMEYGFGIANGTYAPVSWQIVNDTVWATANVKIRKYPSSFAMEMGYLPIGKYLPRVAVYGEWSRVKMQDTEYYIDNKYLVNDPNLISSAQETEAVTEPLKAEETTESTASSELKEVQEQHQSGGFFEKIKATFGEDLGIILTLVIGVIAVIILIIVVAIRNSGDIKKTNGKNKKK